jgi:hypothetical protein
MEFNKFELDVTERLERIQRAQSELFELFQFKQRVSQVIHEKDGIDIILQIGAIYRTNEGLVIKVR